MNEKQRQALEHIADCQTRARANPNNLVRVYPGWYYVYTKNELVEIDYQGDEGLPQWVAKAVSGAWYSDPVATLRDIKYHLEL